MARMLRFRIGNGVPPEPGADTSNPGPVSDMVAGTGTPAGAGDSGEPERIPGNHFGSEISRKAMDDGSPAQGSILVADDNEDCRMALTAILESLGYTVHEADDGEAAVTVARRESPDLILMDLMMPGVDGLEATRRIRSSSALDDVCIVAVTAMEGARQASLSAGCDDCILKPVDLKGLDELVAGWMPEG